MCQPSSLPELGGRALTRAANRTRRPNLVYRCTTGGRPHPSHPAFHVARRAGDLPETPPRFFFHDGRATYPRHPVSHRTAGAFLTRALTREPNPVRIVCACPRAGAYMPAPLLRPAPLLGTFFLITECSCSNECQMLQRLAIFIRAVGRVAAQADSTTACQNALTRRKLAIRLLVGKQSFVQIAPTCESPRGLCQTLPRYKPTIAPPLMRIILMSLPTFRS